ncbi:MAG: adenine deaminase [Bacteroidetes bacterium]|nr:MAG: adenine deaminase [Bacteroidota bacterium]
MNVRIKSNLVDILARKIYPASISVINGKIDSVEPLQSSAEIESFILPGFIDAHVHVESSMLVPSEFARIAVIHGTVATVSDPHEIANVCGIRGVEFMLENGSSVPFKFYFGAPSCVPATRFETAGASLDAAAVESLLDRNEVKYLSEMMNFPGVLAKDKEVMAKINAAQKRNKPVDGHAPGLRGQEAKEYIDAGITTDHECFTREEALDKLNDGMKIIVREGSAAKNFEALVDLLHDHWDKMMFCSDDKHPDNLVAGHINQLCIRAVARGIDIFKVLQVACINPVNHYHLDVGQLRPGDPADFILIKDLKKFEHLATYINGEKLAENGKSLIRPANKKTSSASSPINNFQCTKKSKEDFRLPAEQANAKEIDVPIIEALDGQLITNKSYATLRINGGQLESDVSRDILKIVVVNRYSEAPIAKAFIKNFGLKEGAIASSVAHDSHNIVAVGADDQSLAEAVNLVIEARGGISCVGAQAQMVLELPVAGLMSQEDGWKVAEAYTAIDLMSKKLGSNLTSPFMTLSFMALLVIPHLKLSDRGLFDGDHFRFV